MQKSDGGICWFNWSGTKTTAAVIGLLNGGITINKKLFRYNTSAQRWDLLSANDSLHVADKIRVELELNCPKKLTYVFIDDKRAACFEPIDALSGYEYGPVSYYESVRDAGFQFLADKIPAGISSIRYEMLVVKPGRFHYGPTALQCMYQPGEASYSGSSSVLVTENKVHQISDTCKYRISGGFFRFSKVQLSEASGNLYFSRNTEEFSRGFA